MKTSFIAAVALAFAALFSANLAQARDRVVIVQDRGFVQPHYQGHGHYRGNHGHRHHRHNHRRHYYHSYPHHYSYGHRNYGPVVRYRGPSVIYIAPRHNYRRW